MHLTAARWRRKGPPGLCIWDPRSFTDDDIRTLWRFRRRFVELKPTVDPEVDYDDFAALVRSADHAVVWLRHGELAAMVFHLLARRRVGAGEATVIFGEFAFSSVRGHPFPALCEAWLIGQVALRRPLAPIYFCGFVYPASFLFGAAKLPRVWILGEDAMPVAERELARELARTWGKSRWDPARCLYDFPTRPRELSPRTPTDRHRQLLARYERVSPRWREGQGVFALARLDLTDAVRFAAAAVARSLRRATRRVRAVGAD